MRNGLDCLNYFKKWGICYLCSHHSGPTWIICLFYSNIKAVLKKPCSFHIIFLIFWLSLPNNNFSMSKIWLRFIDGIYPITHVWISILAPFYCKIKLVYFWVHLNTRPNCVIVENLYWPYLLQDTTTNNASDRIVVFRNFLNPDLIGSVKYSWRYVLSSIFQVSEGETLSIPSDNLLVSQWFSG